MPFILNKPLILFFLNMLSCFLQSYSKSPTAFSSLGLGSSVSVGQLVWTPALSFAFSHGICVWRWKEWKLPPLVKHFEFSDISLQKNGLWAPIFISQKQMSNKPNVCKILPIFTTNCVVTVLARMLPQERLCPLIQCWDHHKDSTFLLITLFTLHSLHFLFFLFLEKMKQSRWVHAWKRH